jgi:hypothetical protein
MTMDWGGWMVPDVAPESELGLRMVGLRLAQTVQHNPQAVVDLAINLAHQNLQFQSIVSKATARIAELEEQQAAHVPD